MQAEEGTETLTLRSLGPKYEPELHSRHVSVLVKMLTEKTDAPAKNIALAGHYGSGKSSVILGLQAELAKRKVPWVNLSLSSLGIDDTKRARVQDDGSAAPLTNLIQKEIVKQLLYRKAPSDMPGSRYFRIDSFQWKPAVLWSVATGLTFFVVAVLFGLVKRVNTVAPKKVVASHDWAAWAAVAGLGVLVAALTFLAMRSLQKSRFDVDSVSAGGAAVQLSKPANSYFDEYLDEIVYFFQRTKTQVAIFEDLDRFKDPHIFETLRELNTVLNNSEQLSARPVRFVYAVRDSIFEQLDRPGSEPDEDPSDVDIDAATLESSPFANRTKFFDLVVPMVPFITHRSARDLVAEEFSGGENQPDPALVNLVGARLTDMRLIRNIRNEFEIYRVSILGSKGLRGLTADRLFAMMVYKNLHLEDFEAIRHGRSRIDLAHRAYREMVTHQIGYQSAVSQAALRRAESAALWDEHCSTAGARLAANLGVVQRGTGRSGQTVLIHNDVQYELTALGDRSFWKALFETRDSAVLYVAGYRLRLSFEDILNLAGDSAASIEHAVNANQVDLRRASRAALRTKDDVAKATMAQLMARTDLTMPTPDGDKNLADIVAGLVSPLACDLIAAGHIDENFTLYCSDYHAVAISVSAMNFILHCVQPGVADYQFKFDEPASIDAVASETGARFADGESIFNIEVFDHYLENDPKTLEAAVTKLVVRVGDDTTFVDAYLSDGRRAKKFVRLLADRWPGVFVHLIERASLSPHARTALVDAAVFGASPSTEYETSGPVQQFIAENYPQMGSFTSNDSVASAERTASVIGALGVEIGALAHLSEALRRAVVQAGLYPVTRPNLEAALGETSLALDSMASASQPVHSHVLANLKDYLAALDDDDPTVGSPAHFVSTLADVLIADEHHLRDIAERAADGCVVDDLAALDEKAWEPIVASGRFAATAANVCLFVNSHGVAASLATVLASRSIASPEELDEAERVALAYELADSEDLSAADRVRLIGELDLAERLEASSLGATARAILPAMVTACLVPDDAETYAAISDDEYSTREEFFAASDELADFVCDLPLSASDVAKMMKSSRVDLAVKRAMIDDVEFVRQRLTRTSALAICEWAAYGHAVSVPLVIALAEAQAPAEHILGMLEPHLASIGLDDLVAVLVGLGDEYEPLTRRGTHRPKLKPRPGTTELLDTLKKFGPVSSYSGPGLLGTIRVNMRH